jgi:cytochrome b561
MNQPKAWRRYGITAQALHWIIAGLIVTQFVLARMAAHLPLGARKLALLAKHKSFGMTVFVLAARSGGAQTPSLEPGRCPRSNASRAEGAQ